MKLIGIVVGFFGVVFLISAIAAIPVYLLWNWVAPSIFDLPAISFWQSFGLNLLCQFLFGGHSKSKS